MKKNIYLLCALCIGLFVFANCKTKNDPSAFCSTTITNDTIQIVSLGFNEKELLPLISAKIQSYYHHPTTIKEIQMPAFLISPIRKRYDADKTIAFLKEQNKSHYKFVAGLTSKDICTPLHGIKDWGVFGLGSLDGSGCISSTFRMKKGVSQAKLLERLEKVVLHEIGHNHGLNHCVSPYPCFMKNANGSIDSVDKEPMDMCIECKKKIKF